MSYQVRLEVFEGPLDLLLKLIRREELEITSVSLAVVTDQYMAYMDQLQAIEPGAVASFLEVAAQLVLIKSRFLLPRPDEESLDEDEEDPAEELARRLREYAQYKEAANTLRGREENGLRAYVRIAPLPDLQRQVDLGDMSIDDLISALRDGLEKESPTQPVSQVLERIAVTIDERIAKIRHALTINWPVSFRSLLADCRHRIEIIITFLALLELVKAEEVRVWQDVLFGDIFIQPAAIS